MHDPRPPPPHDPREAALPSIAFATHTVLRARELIPASPGILRVVSLTLSLPPGETVGIDVWRGMTVKVITPRAPAARSYSVTSHPWRAGSFDLTLKVYPGGRSSAYLGGLRAGAALRVGRPRPPPALRKRRLAGGTVCVVAMGMGITGALQVARGELRDGGVRRVTLLYANRVRGGVALRGEVDALEGVHGGRVQVVWMYSGERVEGALWGRVDAHVLREVFGLHGGVEACDGHRFVVTGSDKFIAGVWCALGGMGFGKERFALLLKGTEERV